MTIGCTRLLLVDDHTLFRESLRRLLETEPGMKVCGDFSNAGDAMAALAKGVRFDAALIDYELSATALDQATGLDLVRQIRVEISDANILMVTAGMEADDLRRAVKELHAGVFLKTEPMAELLLAIRRTARGEQWISSRVALALMAAAETPVKTESGGRGPLNQRESQVLRGVLEGKSNKEIGADMLLSESSVKAVLQKLFEKTSVRSRSQLVRYAIETQIETR
jgi:DNA-binding NarL/FixJ family response regulator